MIIAQPDDIVTCERGHPLFIVTRPLEGMMNHTDLESGWSPK